MCYKMLFTISIRSVTYYILFSLFFIKISNAQNNKLTDSLKNVLSKSGSDTTRVNLLNQLSIAYYDIENADSSMHYANQALQEAKKINYKKGLARAYRNFAGVELVKGNYPIALEHYKESLYYYQQLNDVKGEGAVITNMGIVYYQQSIYSEAQKCFFKALQIDINLKDSVGISEDYRNIGMVFNQQKKPEEALRYNLQALEIQKAMNDEVNMAITYNNIGSAYSSMDRFEEALKNHKEAVRLMQKAMPDNVYGLSYYYHNIAVAQKKMGNFKESREYLMKMLDFKKKVGDVNGIATAYYEIGDIFLRQKEITPAKKWLADALNLAQQSKSNKLLSRIYSGLAVADSTTGNYKNALNYYQQHTRYNDSIFNEENTKEITRLQANFEYSQKEDSILLSNQKTIAVKEAHIAANKKQKWMWIGGSVLLAVIGMLLFYQNRIQQKNNLQLTMLNNELDEKATQNQLLVKEMHHRIKNNLYMIYSLLNIQSHNTNNRETQEQLQAARHRIESIAATHEQLYQNQPGNVAMKAYIEQFVSRAIQQLNSNNTVTTHININPEILLNTATCMPLAMLVNEWITNSMKYAAAPDNQLHLFINGNLNSNNEAALEYYDNGIENKSAVSVKPTASGGMGKRIIELLSKQIKGKLNAQYLNKPYHYNIVFPL